MVCGVVGCDAAVSWAGVKFCWNMLPAYLGWKWANIGNGQIVWEVGHAACN